MQSKFARAALCALPMLAFGVAHSQSYPTKTVRVITPFPAGSHGTPKAIVDQIDPDVAKAIVEPDVRERYASFGYKAWPLSLAETAAAMEADVLRYADTIKRLNLQLDYPR